MNGRGEKGGESGVEKDVEHERKKNVTRLSEKNRREWKGKLMMQRKGGKIIRKMPVKEKKRRVVNRGKEVGRTVKKKKRKR